MRIRSITRTCMVASLGFLLLTQAQLARAAKPTQAEGAAALQGALPVMQGLCDSCCKDCPPDKCKKEAQAIVDAIVAAWNANYGNGSNTSKDNIGGYLCWDWARFFRDAASGTNPQCWKVDFGMAWKGAKPGPGVWQVQHYWTSLWACAKTDECKVMIDDDWFDGKFVHRPVWPGQGWPEDTVPIPPVTPKKSGPSDFAALAIIAVVLGFLYFLKRGFRPVRDGAPV